MCIWLHGVAAKLLGGLVNPVYEGLEPGVDARLAVLRAGLPPGDDAHLGGALVPVHPQRPARVTLALELQTKVIRRHPKISQSLRRPRRSIGAPNSCLHNVGSMSI